MLLMLTMLQIQPMTAFLLERKDNPGLCKVIESSNYRYFIILFFYEVMYIWFGT